MIAYGETMLLMCKEGDRSCETKTPRSQADSTTGNVAPLILRLVLWVILPIFNMKQLAATW